MKRVVIVGCAGAGKTTLARKLSSVLDLPHVSLDYFCWKAGWIPVDQEEKIETQQRLVKEDSWIMDGNYDSTLEIRLSTCDTAIFLDFDRFTCLSRVFWRTIFNLGKPRPELPTGCVDRFSSCFFKWIWNFPNNDRLHIIAKLNNFKDRCDVVVLKNQSEVDAFVARISTTSERNLQKATKAV